MNCGICDVSLQRRDRCSLALGFFFFFFFFFFLAYTASDAGALPASMKRFGRRPLPATISSCCGPKRPTGPDRSQQHYSRVRDHRYA